jgi:ubiquinone/menaquinone biosynthesis C-methylase UbiE
MRIPVKLHPCPAEALPFPDASLDMVISTLVLCTAKDVPKSLAEAKRVLKPDGTLRFIEHVRGEGILGRVQEVVTPAWHWFGAEYHPNRRTA